MKEMLIFKIYSSLGGNCSGTNTISLLKAFKPTKNKAIKLAGTNYLNMMSKSSNSIYLTAGSMSDLSMKTRNEISANNIKNLMSISKYRGDECQNEPVVEYNRAVSSKPNVVKMSKFARNADLDAAGILTEEGTYQSTVFINTEVPIEKNTRYRHTRTFGENLNSKEKFKPIMISRKGFSKIEKKRISVTPMRVKTDRLVLSKVFDCKNNLPRKNKITLSKMKELKIELMHNERKNRKILDELAKMRIQHNDYLKYFRSTFYKEKRMKDISFTD